MSSFSKERQEIETQKDECFPMALCESVVKPGTGPVLFILFEISFNFHAAFLAHKIILR